MILKLFLEVFLVGSLKPQAVETLEHEDALLQEQQQPWAAVSDITTQCPGASPEQSEGAGSPANPGTWALRPDLGLGWHPGQVQQGCGEPWRQDGFYLPSVWHWGGLSPAWTLASSILHNKPPFSTSTALRGNW